MRELKVTLTFKSRADDKVLAETISYFIPECGVICKITLANKNLLTCQVYDHEFLFDENRVVLLVNILN